MNQVEKLMASYTNEEIEQMYLESIDFDKTGIQKMDSMVYTDLIPRISRVSDLGGSINLIFSVFINKEIARRKYIEKTGGFYKGQPVHHKKLGEAVFDEYEMFDDEATIIVVDEQGYEDTLRVSLDKLSI